MGFCLQTKSIALIVIHAAGEYGKGGVFGWMDMGGAFETQVYKAI